MPVAGPRHGGVSQCRTAVSQARETPGTARPQ